MVVATPNGVTPNVDYDAVYLPGGHGPMSDLAWDADCGRLLTAQLASGRPLFIVCHAPAAILATRIHGVSPCCCAVRAVAGVGYRPNYPLRVTSAAPLASSTARRLVSGERRSRAQSP